MPKEERKHRKVNHMKYTYYDLNEESGHVFRFWSASDSCEATYMCALWLAHSVIQQKMCPVARPAPRRKSARASRALFPYFLLILHLLILKLKNE